MCRRFPENKKQSVIRFIVSIIDPKKEIIVASAASNYEIRAVILYKLEDGTTNPTAYVSRTLLPAERNYSQIEKENLGIMQLYLCN